MLKKSYAYKDKNGVDYKFEFNEKNINVEPGAERFAESILPQLEKAFEEIASLEFFENIIKKDHFLDNKK